MKKTAFFVCALLLVFSCGRFRVQKLSPALLYEYPVNQPNGLHYPKTGSLIHGVPARAAVIDDWNVFSEPADSSIRIFQGGELKTVIRSKQPEQPNLASSKNITNIVYPELKIPGNAIAGNEEDFYVVHYLPVETKAKGLPSGNGLYRILHFKLNGQFLESIGRGGQSELSFEQILWMDVDSEGGLWVFYRYLDSLRLDRYFEGQTSVFLDEDKCKEVLFNNAPSEEKLLLSCEFMMPFEDGDSILLSGRVDRLPKDPRKVEGYSFQYRVLRTYDTNSGEIRTLFERLNDPEDFPYMTYGNENFIFWETKNDNTIRLARYNLDADLTENFQIIFPPPRNSWRSTWMTLRREIFSLQVLDNKVRIYEWK